MEGVDPRKRHKVSFKYRGEVPMTMDPESCLRLLRSFPEMEDGVSDSDLRDPALAFGELAVGHVWLMSLQGRLEMAHKAEVDALKEQLGQRTWELGVAEEAKRKLAEELDVEKERARARDEELVAQNRRVEELKLEAESLRKDFVASDMEVARLQAQLDIAGRAREESEGKANRMNGMCRRQVKRLLNGQRSKFRKACRKQSRRAVKVVQGYLESRRPWNRVDKLVSQAEEAERILLRLRSDGVPIPEDKVASVVAAKEKYALERGLIQQKTMSAEDFEFVVPSNLGVPNIDQMDFSSVLPYGEEDEEYYGGSTDEGDRSEEESVTEGEEGEEESEEEDDEEEEEVPLFAKGAASGVRPDSENPQPVSEAGGTTRDAREGGEEDRSVAAQPGAESATVVVRPEGDGSDVVPPAGEKTPHEDQPGGNGSEEVARVGEGTSLATEGAPADVQLEGEVTPGEVEG